MLARKDPQSIHSVFLTIQTHLNMKEFSLITTIIRRRFEHRNAEEQPNRLQNAAHLLTNRD